MSIPSVLENDLIKLKTALPSLHAPPLTELRNDVNLDYFLYSYKGLHLEWYVYCKLAVYTFLHQTHMQYPVNIAVVIQKLLRVLRVNTGS